MTSGFEEDFCWKSVRKKSSLSTAIRWGDRYCDFCQFDRPFSSSLRSEIYFSIRISQLRPDWRSLWFKMSNLRDRVKSQTWSFCTASSAELEGPLLLAAGHRSISIIPADHRQSLLPAGHNIVHNVASLMCVQLPTTNLYLRWTMIKFCFLTESRVTKPYLTLGEALATFFSCISRRFWWFARSDVR